MRPLTLIAAALLVVPVLPAAAAPGVEGRGALPPGARQLRPLEAVARYQVPAIDIDQVLQADLWLVRLGLPFRYAAPHEVDLSPANAGTWERLGADRLLWRLRLGSPGALSLNLGFSRFRLPPGARLYLYSPDGAEEIGPFTERDNEAHGQLWTPPLASAELVLELTVPTVRRHQVELQLSRINHGFDGFGQPGLKAGDCNLDVACPSAAAWSEPARAVGLISVGGTYFCTGFLVNNVRQDARPFFITAHHCGIHEGNAASVVVMWAHSRPDCRQLAEGADATFPVRMQDGSRRRFQTGAWLRAEILDTDITLVELDDPPDPALVAYAGWDRRAHDPRQTVAIHHPRTGAKRVSIDRDPASTTSHLQAVGPGDGSHLRVGDWEQGTTEGGSSGAPLFDQDRHVVGVLHGGHAACGARDADWFGRLSAAWEGGGRSERLRDWLDPDGTGAWVLDGLTPQAGLGASR